MHKRRCIGSAIEQVARLTLAAGGEARLSGKRVSGPRSRGERFVSSNFACFAAVVAGHDGVAGADFGLLRDEGRHGHCGAVDYS